MRVLEPNEPTTNNMCCVCGQGLDRQRMTLILDTGYDMDFPGQPFDGKKYVGQCCIWDIARAAGLTTATQVADIKAYLRSYRNSAEQIQAEVEEALDKALQRLNELPAPPNIDHLESPDHVLVAEANAAKEKTWVEIPEELPF